MTDVLLLHSALGRRPATEAYRQALEREGHRVVAPDLYDGQVFRLPEEGTSHMKWLGWERLSARAESAAADMPVPFAVVGMSMGAGLAGHLAVSRPGISGVVMLYSGEPPEGTWPHGVPVEVHHTIHDPWADVSASCALVTAVAHSGSPSSLHLYRGARHLIDDADLPDHHDPGTAAVVWRRVVAFLAELP